MATRTCSPSRAFADFVSAHARMHARSNACTLMQCSVCPVPPFSPFHSLGFSSALTTVQDHGLDSTLPLGAVDLVFSKACRTTLLVNNRPSSLSSSPSGLSPDHRHRGPNGSSRNSGSTPSRGRTSAGAAKKLDFDAFLRALLEVAAISSSRHGHGHSRRGSPGSRGKGRRSSSAPRTGAGGGRQHAQADVLVGLTPEAGTALLREMALDILGRD